MATIQSTYDQYLPFLNEIRKKLVIILSVFLVGFVIGFIFYQPVLVFILKQFNLTNINIVLTSPYQFINLSVNTGFIAGLILSSPIFIIYLLGFIKPALTKKEYQLITKLIPLSVLLFVVGFSFGIWITKFVIDLFSKTTTSFQVQNLWDISQFFSQFIITGISLAFAFQLPIVLTILLRLKIVKKSFLTKQRPYIYLGILIFAALLPPTDLVSLSLLFTTPLLLYEIALLFNK